jgi:hypothetical protein
MAGIVPTLEPDYIVGLPGKKVHHLALAFITPVNANNDSNRHLCSLLNKFKITNHKLQKIFKLQVSIFKFSSPSNIYRKADD